MLPSRLFRCIGIPPPLRSLMVIHPALPPSLAVQLRLRLQILPRSLSTSMSSHSHSPHTKSKSSDSDVSLRHHEHCHPSSSSLPPARTPEHEESERSQEQEPRLQLTLTCTVSGCSERSTHRFTKRAYERGIVLVTCPKCKNRHLIADHIGWFKESTEDGKLRTIEDLMRQKGEKVVRGRIDAGGVIEYA